MTKPLVGITIINWNGHQDTIRCLESISKISYTNYEIFLIDNGSTDNSIQEIEQAFPDIKIMKNRFNEGFAHANNQAIEYGNQNEWDYVLFLNNDTIVHEDFLTVLLAKLEQSSTLGVVGPKIYYADMPDKIWFAGGKIDYKNFTFEHMSIGDFDNHLNSTEKNVDYISGCCLLTSLKLLNKVGLWSEQYFMYVEDVDLCQKVKRLGYISLYVPESKIWHKVSSSSGGEINPTKEYYKARNHLIFISNFTNGIIKFNRCFAFYWRSILKSLYYLKRFEFRISSSIISGLVAGTMALLFPNRIWKRYS